MAPTYQCRAPFIINYYSNERYQNNTMKIKNTPLTVLMAVLLFYSAASCADILDGGDIPRGAKDRRRVSSLGTTGKGE